MTSKYVPPATKLRLSRVQNVWYMHRMIGLTFLGPSLMGKGGFIKDGSGVYAPTAKS